MAKCLRIIYTVRYPLDRVNSEVTLDDLFRDD